MALSKVMGLVQGQALTSLCGVTSLALLLGCNFFFQVGDRSGILGSAKSKFKAVCVAVKN